MRVYLAIWDIRICKSVRMNLISRYNIPNEHILDCGKFIEVNNLANDAAHFCTVCGNYVQEFKPFLTESGTVQEAVFCPMCGSWHRWRFQRYVLSKYTEIFEKPCSVLCFAPEDYLIKTIAELNPECSLVTADIQYGRGNLKLDIMNMSVFADNSFDYFIANHVLEHVTDDKKAVDEIKRIIKPNGKIILSLPVSKEYPITIEDTPDNGREDRIRLFGQSDHVRGYGTDYRARFEKFGLNVLAVSPESELSEDICDHWGLAIEGKWLDVNMVCSIK